MYHRTAGKSEGMMADIEGNNAGFHEIAVIAAYIDASKMVYSAQFIAATMTTIADSEACCTANRDVIDASMGSIQSK